MKKNKRFFSKFMTAAAVFASLFVVCDLANAATRRSGRSVPAARKNITATKTVATTQPVEQNSEPETIVETVEEPVVTVAKEIPEQIIMNKSNQFENTISDIMESAAPDNSFAEEIRRQRAALAASESESTATGNQQRALATNSHTCDVGLRKCMSEICGKDFTKCATDGDTAFGDKLDRCRRNTECSAEEFSLFTTEIKADRDVNVKLSSYNSVVECGNSYNACIMNECGTMYNKCLGKTAENAAIQKCSTVAKECNEADSGLTSRFGTAIGKLRENAEKDIKKDEQRLYTLRDLMEKQCKSLGAAFDERSFDCVYTVNFYAGENQSAPLASRKAYAGDSFVCMQEWFGVNTTTAQENAYRETRAQTAASSAMLGSGLGMAAGAISSGAIDRAIDTTKKCKEIEAEWKATQMSTYSGTSSACARFWKEKSEKLDKLQKEMAECKATEQSNANRLLTAASSVATGIGGKELAQGLAEQKADRAAEQSMSAYIATMRCSYGNGKQVKAGTEEIELPGGNDGNIMKYRAEYVTLAADLKERKTALGLKPGIESEEILDKSQMGLYDDENIGISDGAYASLYRAQMLGSEKDQQQIDDAKQTSKNRVIGGAVAAGVGVVGGIIGDELINQSLSSSTKTAQTCTESGGTWQGGRCHCPDGFIQHTKTGPCFEEKPTEVQTTTNQQTPVESSNSPPPQGQNNNSSNSNSSSDNGYGNGDNDDNDEQNFDFDFGDITELDEEVEPLPEPIITYEKQQNCKTSNGQWIDGTCVCRDSQYTPDVSGKCVYAFGSINQPTVIPVPPNDTTGVNSDGSQTNSSVTPTNVAAQTNPNIDASQQTDTPTCGVVGKKECNSNYYVCASDSDCTSDKLPANATAGHCWKSGSRSVCTATACENGFDPSQGRCVRKKDISNDQICEEEGPDYINNCVCTGGTVNPRDGSCTCPNNQKPNAKGSCPKTQQRQVTPRSQQKPTAPRANTTNGRTTNNNDLSKQDMSKDGTFAKAYDAEGECDIKRNEDLEFRKSTSWCDDLYKGEWKVQFDYGLVRGESKCSNTKGKDNSAGSPSNTNGQNCWCKVKTYKPTGGSISNIASPSWVFFYDLESASDCPDLCALNCANGVLGHAGFRRAVFGVAGK